jgi:heme-degrading monooxygenase HmoA
MYASVRTLQINPEKVDEALSTVREMVPQITRRATGLQEVFVLVDRATGKLITTSFWDTEANWKANEGLFQEAMSKVAAFVVTPPVRLGGFDIVERFQV